MRKISPRRAFVVIPQRKNCIDFRKVRYLEVLVRGRVRRERWRGVDFKEPRLQALVEQDVVAEQAEAMLVVDDDL